MKFNMMIGGVETLFPEAEVCFFKETNDLVIYFLNLNEEILNKTKSNNRNIISDIFQQPFCFHLSFLSKEFVSKI